MANDRYDLLVVGSGPGGQQAAIQAAKLDKRVGLIERKPYLGGVSLQTGTIPSKALREAAFLASRFAAQGMREAFPRRPGMGSDFLSDAVQKKDTVVEKSESILLGKLLAAGVTIIPGEAGFHDPHTLRIAGISGKTEYLSADVIVLATGSRPRRPADVPFDKERVLDSTSILRMRRLPASLLVIGGGVIACEFATIFAPLGVGVTVVDSHEQLLAYLDEDIAGNLMENMLDMGITLHLRARVKSIHREGERVQLLTDVDELHEADALLYAMGRQPNFDRLNLDRAGLVADDRGWVRVDEHFRTPVPHIYVIGDLVGRPSLASTAMEQGRLVANIAFGKKGVPSPAPLPMAIYTIPELSYAGETERELAQREADYVAGKAGYGATARGQIIGDYRGTLKLLADRATRRLLGVHIIGEGASELVHVGQMLMGCNGTVDMLAANVFNYPTLAECYKTAALDCIDQLGEA
ncbi:MAG: Si-specific NAD(P)(+) transhydrogenase [Gammaproteobacteria bacterium]